MTDTTDKTIVCFLCGKPVTEDDYCYGCREHICEECDVNFSLIGGHDPQKHLEETWDGDDD